MRNLRVLFVTQEFDEHNAGGSGVFARELTAALAALDVQVHVLTPGDSNQRQVRSPNLIVHRCKVIPRRFLRVPSFHWRVWRSAQDIIQAEGINLIHCNDTAAVTILRRLPCVATIHHPVRSELRLSTLFQMFINVPDALFEKIVVRRAQFILVPSHLVRDLIVAMESCAQSKIRIVYNGVGSIFFRSAAGTRQLRQDLKIQNDELFIFFPGGARAKRKGALDLMKALGGLEPHLKYRCIISGQSREAGWGN